MSNTQTQDTVRIAVFGCLHGELHEAYRVCEEALKKDGRAVDLLICCGDFQSFRNESDLSCFAAPPKYRLMGQFYEYYSGEKIAPIPTIFIHGNHEASNFLMELPYGGWVARNIYYMGFAGVVNYGGVRIGGISGIYKAYDYHKGRYETCPLSDDALHTIYHTREYDMQMLEQISTPIDFMLSHDWPGDVAQYGNTQALYKMKEHIVADIESGKLGNPHSMQLLQKLAPTFWCSAHMHVKYTALVPTTQPQTDSQKQTKFLALDKITPGRHYVQILDVPARVAPLATPVQVTDGLCYSRYPFEYDKEWLSILKSNAKLYPRTVKWMKPGYVFPDGRIANYLNRTDYTPTQAEIDAVEEAFSKHPDGYMIPNNFEPTALPYTSGYYQKSAPRPPFQINRQTVVLCEKLGISVPNFGSADPNERWYRPVHCYRLLEQQKEQQKEQEQSNQQQSNQQQGNQQQGNQQQGNQQQYGNMQDTHTDTSTNNTSTNISTSYPSQYQHNTTTTTTNTSNSSISSIYDVYAEASSSTQQQQQQQQYDISSAYPSSLSSNQERGGRRTRADMMRDSCSSTSTNKSTNPNEYTSGYNTSYNPNSPYNKPYTNQYTGGYNTNTPNTNTSTANTRSVYARHTNTQYPPPPPPPPPPSHYQYTSSYTNTNTNTNAQYPPPPTDTTTTTTTTTTITEPPASIVDWDDVATESLYSTNTLNTVNTTNTTAFTTDATTTTTTSTPAQPTS